jgi:acyl-CoA thioester hydrolase
MVSTTPFSWRIRVYWEDTDAGGVVYHAGYLRFMERARSEWLRALGIDQGALSATRALGFLVRDMQLDFLAPARLDDELEVSVAVQGRRAASMTFAQAVRRVGEERDLVSATVRVACVDLQRMRPTPIPDDLSAQMDEEPANDER